MLSEAIRKTFLGLVEVNKETRTAGATFEVDAGAEMRRIGRISGLSANPAIGHTSDLLAA